MTEQSLPLILKGICSAQWEKPFKNLAELLKDPSNKALFLEAIQHDDADARENIGYLIWGKQWRKQLP